jgi:hypothetical protein
MNLDDPSKAIDVRNRQEFEALDGYFAWRRASDKGQRRSGKVTSCGTRRLEQF